MIVAGHSAIVGGTGGMVWAGGGGDVGVGPDVAVGGTGEGVGVDWDVWPLAFRTA